MHDHGFWVTSSLALDNWEQKNCQTLGNKPNPSTPIIFDRFTFTFLKNRQAKNTVYLRFIRLSFPSKKSEMNSLYNEKRQWRVPMVWRKNIHAVCCEDNYFPNGKVKLFNSLFHSVCFFNTFWFLLPICLPCVTCGTYVTRINAVSWHTAQQTF